MSQYRECCAGQGRRGYSGAEKAMAPHARSGQEQGGRGRHRDPQRAGCPFPRQAAQRANALHMLIESRPIASPSRRSGRKPTAIQQSGSASANVISCGRKFLRGAKSNPGSTRTMRETTRRSGGQETASAGGRARRTSRTPWKKSRKMLLRPDEPGGDDRRMKRSR